MSEELKIKFGADVGGAINGLQVLQKQLDRLQKLASMPGLSFAKYERLNTLFKETSAKVDQFSRVVGQAPASLNKVANSSNQATFAMMNLGRVVQDAPYGFIGIANNLNPLLESFQRLRATSTSTGGAFKALGASLMGAGGIGFALSIVSSALVLFGDNLFGSSKKADDLSSDLNNLTSEANRVKDAIEKVSKELTFLQQIGNITVDFNFGDEFTRSSLKAQQASVALDTEIYKVNESLKDLEKNADNAFKNFDSKTSFKTKQKLGDFLITNIPDDVISDLNSSEEKVVKALKDAYKERDKVQAQLEDLESKRSIARSNIRLNIQEDQRKKEKEAFEKSTADYKKYVSETISEAQRLFNAFKGGTDLKLDFGLFDTEKQKFSKSLAFLDKLKISKEGTLKFKFTIEPTVDLKNIDTPDLEKEAEPLVKESERFGGVLGKEFSEYFANNLNIDTSLVLAFQKAESPAAKAAEALKKSLESTLNEGLQALAVEGITSFAEGLGSALATGDLEQGFKNFSSVIADGFSSIGKHLIAASPIIKALKVSLKTLNPAVMLASGIALVAIGAALKSSMTIKGARAKGGPVTKSDSFLVGEEGPELFVPKSDGFILPHKMTKSMMNSSFKPSSFIPPQQSAASISNMRVQPGGMIVKLMGEFVQRGRDMVATISQETKSQTRLA